MIGLKRPAPLPEVPEIFGKLTVPAGHKGDDLLVERLYFQQRTLLGYADLCIQRIKKGPQPGMLLCLQLRQRLPLIAVCRIEHRPGALLDFTKNAQTR